MTDKKLQNVAADSSCFVCGPLNSIGLQAKFFTDVENDSSYAKVTLAEGFQGWKDVVHGGIVSALLDEACIYACRGKADQCVTAELQVRFKKPVAVGSEVIITGELVDSRRKFWRASARLMVNGTLHAEATAKIFVLES